QRPGFVRRRSAHSPAAWRRNPAAVTGVSMTVMAPGAKTVRPTPGAERRTAIAQGQANGASPEPNLPDATLFQADRKSGQNAGGRGRYSRKPVLTPTLRSASGATRVRSQSGGTGPMPQA